MNKCEFLSIYDDDVCSCYSNEDVLCKCHEFDNCYFKQLQALKDRCERYKKDIQQIGYDIDNIDMVFDGSFGISDEGYLIVNDSIQIARKRVKQALEGINNEK